MPNLSSGRLSLRPMNLMHPRLHTDRGDCGRRARWKFCQISLCRDLRHPIDLLFEDRPAPDVSGQQERGAAARRRANDTPSDALVRKGSKVPPAAKLELSGKVGIGLLVVPGILKLTPQQRRIIDPEIHSVTVAQLRIGRRSQSTS